MVSSILFVLRRNVLEENIARIYLKISAQNVGREYSSQRQGHKVESSGVVLREIFPRLTVQMITIVLKARAVYRREPLASGLNL